METKKRALGRGLESLFINESLTPETFEQEVYENVTKEEIFEVDINELRPNPYQPRKIFEESALLELSDSIKKHGVFQPIIIKKSIKGYEIIAGERRYRASKMAGLEKIPAIIRNLTDEQMMEIALLENLQREQLNAIEEALAYKNLLEKLAITQDELAKKVSKSRSHITNMIGLLRLPKEVQKMILENKITMGHARVLSKLEDETKIIELANQIVDNKLAVRNVEDIASDKERKIKVKKKEPNTEFKYVEDLLKDKLDTRVKIKEKSLEISFTNVADLNRILEILNIKGD